MKKTIAGLLFALACHAQQAPSGTAGGFPNFDDWQNEALGALSDAAELSHTPPGTQTTTSLTVCIGGKLYSVAFVLFVTAQGGGQSYSLGPPVLSGDCDPSNNLTNGNLSNFGVIQTIEDQLINRLQEFASQSGSTRSESFAQAVPETTASTTSFTLFASYLDVLMIPYFSSADFPVNPLPCNPANGAQLLQVNHGSGTVTLVDGCSNQPVKTIPVVSAPLQVAGTPDGTQAIVTSFNNAINFISLSTNTVTKTLTTTSDIYPSGIAITADGSTAYVTSFSGEGFGTAALLVVNIATQSVTSQMPLADFPQSVFLTPDGALAWIVHPLTNQLTIVDTLSMTIVQTFSITAPGAVAFNSTATKAYITSGGTPGSLIVMNTANYQTLATVQLSTVPVELLMGLEDGALFVSNYVGESIEVIDPNTFQVVTTVPLPGRPRGLALVQ